MKEVHKMKVIVFIKQIPDSSDVKLDENGNLIRSGVGTMINPVDKNALELGLALRDRFGGSVTAVTMGPPQAKDVLKRALFMGCDKAVLLSDRIFGGADTLATGYVLSMAARKLGDFDLAIFGNKASDAETAQTGPVTAGFLGLPLVTSVDALELDGNAIVCRRSFTGGTETSKTALPAVITVTPAVNTPRFMTPANVIDGLKRASLSGTAQTSAAMKPSAASRARPHAQNASPSPRSRRSTARSSTAAATRLRKSSPVFLPTCI